MLRIFKSFYGLIFTVLFSFLLIIIYHGKLLTDINNYYLGDFHDGFKNYYTVLYHVKYDSTYSRFEGMNYPFGEHVVFTDNQPLLSNSIKFISKNIVDVSDYTVGIINSFMLLSIVLCCIFLYLIFRELLLPQWFAVLVAVGAGFLSPQIHRMGGHYALSHCYIFPLIWFLVIRFVKNPTLIKSCLTGIVVLLASCLHIYYLGLCEFFISLYMLFSVLGKFSKEHIRFALVHFTIQVLLPLFLINLWFYFTDPVNDRPSNPYGFLAYRAYWESIFLPIGYPLGDFINKIISIRTVPWEGIGYVGLIAFVFFLVALFRFFLLVAKKKFKNCIKISDNNILNISFLAAYMLLLFSFGLPFILGLEFLVDYIGPLRQFRGIARFSWAFFYVLNVIAFFHIYKFCESKIKNIYIKYPVIIFTIFIILFESYWYNNKQKFYNFNRVAEFEDSRLTNDNEFWLNKIDINKYQTIIPIPYFHVGSEVIWVSAEGNILKNVLVASALTGLPTTGVMLSRTSLSQTMENIQFMSEPHNSSLPILSRFNPDKPFLIWLEKKEKIPISQQELISYAKLVYEDESVKLLELQISSIKKRIK